MSIATVDLDGRLTARDAELGMLSDLLDEAGRAGGCALVSGEPGVGKSALIDAFGAEVTRRGGVFASGRHREQADAPYEAWATALGTLVRAMSDVGGAEHDRWRAELDRGTAAGALPALVPELGAAPGEPLEVPTVPAEDARRRLHRAVVGMVALTATYRPVVLALDDLQWADHDSVLLLSELLARSPRNVVVLGAHRTGGFEQASLPAGPGERCTIALDPLPVDGVAELLGRIAGGDATELREASAEFHRRTGGNPLQVRQLLRQVQRVGALRRPDEPGPAAWDLRALGAIEVSADGAEFLARCLDQLADDDRAVVCALGCVGGEFDLADAEAATAAGSDAVARALWAALDLRLIDALDPRGRRHEPVIDRETRYRFSHDRVAEAARGGLSDDAGRDVHLRLGRRLVGLGEGRLFDAARHLGTGGVRSTDAAERARWAELLVKAARRARARAAFRPALEHCRHALDLLGPLRWVEHPALTRDLHLAGAEAACLAADLAAMAELLDEAARGLPDPADRARIALLRVRGLLAAQRSQEALETGLRALADLGEPIPRDPGTPQVAATLLRMKILMRGWGTERLLGLPRCEDRLVGELQAILEQLRNVSYGVRPRLFPVVVRKMVELSLAHGLVPSSPTALASYGVLLAVTGDHDGSQRFGEVGIRLAERPEFRDAWPQALFLHLNFIRHWRHPVAEGLDPLREAVRVALDRGDLEYAGYLTAVLLYQSFWIGRPLSDIDELARSLIPELHAQRVPGLLCRSTQQLCLNLMGRSEDPYLLAGESGYDEREVLPVARREHDEVALGAAAISKLGLHFWCGDAAGGIPVADEVARHLGGMAGTSNVPFFHLVDAMTRMRAEPQGRSTARAVRRSLSRYRKWAAGAPANYAAPAELLAGVWAGTRGDLLRAEQLLDRAIALADEHHLPLMSALARDEAAALHARTGRSSLAELLTREAHARWAALGMTVRTRPLEQRHPWLLGGDLVRRGTVDPGGVHRLLRALAAAGTAAGAAAILLGAVAETTGATRVLLLLGDGADGADAAALTVRSVFEDGSVVDGTRPFDESLVERAVRSGRPVTAAAGPGGAAVLAVPMTLRGRTTGVVYAENPDPVLGPQHQETLTVLCGQAASPLRNFELEDRLADVEDAGARFVPHELLRILDIGDLGRVRRGHRVERPMTVLVSDIRGYATLLEGMSPSEASELTSGFLQAVELPIVANNGVLQDVRGDEIVAVFDSGAGNGADDAVRAALAMQRSLAGHNRDRAARGSEVLRVGIGINTGTVGIGLVGGVNRMVLTVLGDAVNLASRVEGTNKRYGTTVLVSDETRDRLTGPFDVRRMERVMVVNRRRPVTIHEVFDEDPDELRAAKRAAGPAFDEAFARFDAGDGAGARAAFERCRALLPGDQVAPLHIGHSDALLRGDLAGGQEVVLHQK